MTQVAGAYQTIGNGRAIGVALDTPLTGRRIDTADD